MTDEAEWVPDEMPPQLRADARVEKWKRWLDERIRPEVLGMYWNRHIYRRVGEIVNSRQPALPPSYFFDHMRDTYAITQAVAIRRQAETSTRVVSLGSLLREIAGDAGRLTRERFLSHFPLDQQGRGGTTFDQKFAGSIGNHVDPAIVASDIDVLTMQSQRVVDYVDRHIAHVDRAPLHDLPTFEDANRAIDAIGETFDKYVLLLTASTYWTLIPTPQEDWEGVFDFPWRQ